MDFGSSMIHCKCQTLSITDFILIRFTFGAITTLPHTSYIILQVLQTTYVEGWYSFVVNETVYSIMFKPSVVGEMTSQPGSAGNVGSVDMATLLFTTLFRWQGELVPVQVGINCNIMSEK